MLCSTLSDYRATECRSRALSRKPDFALGALVVVQESQALLGKVRRDAALDQEYQQYDTVVEGNLRRDMIVRDGLLWCEPRWAATRSTGDTSRRGARLFIPAGDLRSCLLYEAPVCQIARHLGKDKYPGKAWKILGMA